jgi:predicted enzyme related to lactoylglutathione lyase
MTSSARFVHINLIAEDWRALAGFYENTLGCVPLLPERDLYGEQLEAGTGLPGAHLRGIHLRLPDHNDSGPTLEIFSYSSHAERGVPSVNRPGLGHIAFSVEDVAAAQQAILQAGGRSVGEIVSIQIGPDSIVTWCYVTDPEGNIIELQSWSK